MKTKFARRARMLRLAAPICVALPLLAATAVRAQTYALTTLATFNGSNGSEPNGALSVDSSGNLYGETYIGGASGDGTVFEIAAGTKTLSTLATFTGSNGANPTTALTLDSSGDLFGTTSEIGPGGTTGTGTVFAIYAGTNTVHTLAQFNGTDGSDPNSGLTIDSFGNLYGTTARGGANNDGTVFEVANGLNSVTALSFNGSNGSTPVGSLTVDSHGNLYGTTQLGGASGDGTVFEIAGGANNDGNVFQTAASTNSVTTLATFSGTNGNQPFDGLTIDSKGNLFGVTVQGGASGDGTVFEIAAGTNMMTTLASFNGANGMFPFASLILDSSGNLYGTTHGGGASGDGTVFEIAAGTNTLATLYSFNGTNGSAPDGGLAIDSSGDLYGSTQYGGADNDGTVFELTPSISGAAAAPEPCVLALLLPVLAPLGLALRRRRRSSEESERNEE